MSDKPAPSVRIRFTAAQLEALAEALPQFADRFQTGASRQCTVEFTLDEAELIHETAEDNTVNARKGVRRHSFEVIRRITKQAIENSKGIASIPKSSRVYQFKITLRDIEPPVWRRVQVRDCTLDRLHEITQLVFGWWNYHLHRFKINNRSYADPLLMREDFEAEDMVSSKRTKVSQIVPKDGRQFSFEYEYDFGDDWIHDVLFEGCLRATPDVRYPFCVEGARACPPEDVGGTHGYAEYLQAMADPTHENHEEFMQWRGPFDPEAFDAEAVTKALRRGLPKPVDY